MDGGAPPDWLFLRCRMIGLSLSGYRTEVQFPSPFRRKYHSRNSMILYTFFILSRCWAITLSMDKEAVGAGYSIESGKQFPKQIFSTGDKEELPLVISWQASGKLQFTAGWYNGDGMAAFKEKLAQFPAGARFHLTTTQAEREAHAADFAEVSEEMAADGLRLEVHTSQ